MEIQFQEHKSYLQMWENNRIVRSLLTYIAKETESHIFHIGTFNLKVLKVPTVQKKGKKKSWAK